MTAETAGQEYIASLRLRDAHVLRRAPQVEQEQQVAMADLLRANHFAPVGLPPGPYDVVLDIADNRLRFQVTSAASGDATSVITLPVRPFRRVIRDYFLICESYSEALKHADPYKLEAVDMGRRAVHNEGSDQFRRLLADKAVVDFDTARRLFTLLCVLHIR